MSPSSTDISEGDADAKFDARQRLVALRVRIADWISTAQATALTTLGNSISIPSRLSLKDTSVCGSLDFRVHQIFRSDVSAARVRFVDVISRL